MLLRKGDKIIRRFVVNRRRWVGFLAIGISLIYGILYRPAHNGDILDFVLGIIFMAGFVLLKR